MVATTNEELGLKVTLDSDFEEAIRRVTDGLMKEGFGVLTEIDVQATMKKKLGIDYPKYKILGACNPTLAHNALSISPDIGLLLPCNVTIVDKGEGKVEVSLVNPLRMMDVAGNSATTSVASEAYSRLSRVAETM